MYCAQGRYMVARKEYPTLRRVCFVHTRVQTVEWQLLRISEEGEGDRRRGL